MTTESDTLLQEKERLQDAGRLEWFHWAIIALSFILTLLAWQYTRTQNKAKNMSRFDRQAEQAVALVSERMIKYEDVLQNSVAAIGTQSYGLTLDKWRIYSEALDISTKYPGINGIGLIDRVLPEELGAYLAEQRKERPDFKIHPDHDQTEYWPITHIEPIATNAAAVGLDIAHESNRYTAAKKAQDEGTAQITGPIILVQDAKQTPGFLFYAPYYKPGLTITPASRKEKFRGLVYAPFIFEKLMDGTLGTDQRLVNLKISDGEDVLFNEATGAQKQSYLDARYKTEVTTHMYGRDWKFDIWSTGAFDKASANNTPMAILLTGLTIDTLIVAIFTLLARSNHSAIKFAEKATAAQTRIALRLNNILDEAPDGIWTSDLNGNLLGANKAAEKMFGYSAEELIGHSNRLFMPNLVEDFAEVFLEETGTHDPDAVKNILGKTREVIARHKDGTEFPMEISVSEMSDQGRPLYNTIGRDISLRRKAEDELGLTMEDLILSNEDLEKFAYIASHDLKSPLRAIDNLSKWLEEDLDAVIDDENRDRVHKLRGRVARMENLLSDLLEYSRAGNKLKDINKLPAGQLVRDIQALLNVPADFTIDIAPELDTIEVARMPLEQIFHNLINNAIKHHDKHTGAIRVSVTPQGENFEFRISDDGPGIAPAFHDKIFEMFQTLRPRDEVEGSGMGLALVKKITHHHGGRIRIESDAGQGSTFVLLWPKRPRLRSRPKRKKEIRDAH